MIVIDLQVREFTILRLVHEVVWFELITAPRVMLSQLREDMPTGRVGQWGKGDFQPYRSLCRVIVCVMGTWPRWNRRRLSRKLALGADNFYG